MIDRAQRAVAADLISRLLRAEITNFQFEKEWPARSHDRALREIRTTLWFIYDDLHEHRLEGKFAPSNDGRKMMLRCIAFLGSNLEYQWEAESPGRAALLFCANLVSLGLIGSILRRRFAERYPAWPFGSVADFERTATR
jgi:hypothetical protein